MVDKNNRQEKGIFKELGNRRTLLLAVADKTEENYQNVQMLLAKVRPLEIERDLETTMDSKMKSIVSGIDYIIRKKKITFFTFTNLYMDSAKIHDHTCSNCKY